MASVSAPTPSPHKLNFPNPKPYPSSVAKRAFYPSSHSQTTFSSRFPDSSLCRCQKTPSSSSDSTQWRWDSALQNLIKNAVKSLDSCVNFRPQPDAQSASFQTDDPDWDWDRWRRHFLEVEQQERLVSLLKLQLGRAVYAEDFEDAARLKVAIAAAAANDVVGRVISHLNRAIQEERYQDAAFFRDNAGAGLVGWWAGLSEDKKDPHGIIIRVTAEHGRYVARSYSPWELATAAAGVPLFEIYLTANKNGEYREQAVYLKQGGVFQDSSQVSSKSLDASGSLNPFDSTEERGDLFVADSEDAEDCDDSDDGSDLSEDISGFQSFLRDMIPNVKVKVLKVTSLGKVDRDLISKVIEQIIEEDDEDKDSEIESLDAEDEEQVEGDEETDVIELDADPGIFQNAERREIAVKVVVGGLGQKLSSRLPTKNLLRVPAKIEKKGRLSFSFTVEKDINQQDSRGREQSSVDKKAKLGGQQGIDNVMFDLSKFMGKEKIPQKVLKDVGELINLALSQFNDHQPLSGTTTFNRIEMPASPDPLNGIYIGAHGLHTSEVIHLRRKFGQWKEDGGTEEPLNLEFYEYVEALKLTGDPYVPAGQVAFRAKIGKGYQLPHKGIIPEEFGVVARYKGQGRLAEPGFRNPRWVDGELVILDGKVLYFSALYIFLCFYFKKYSFSISRMHCDYMIYLYETVAVH
ncbi:protein EXECUTER 1 [Pyrus ussuriensis x Pyrus communis]|uniref:Protein EXECUTER 1 n=1 Tax=Pyrus ussuriensis x Pyrus communis TaxID=2448454 RepID=A0A5N5FJL0_9ROSA|nr:protein EXECUTER 1 [Pyrus ussuriensis x Pyrus communis]